MLSRYSFVLGLIGSLLCGSSGLQSGQAIGLASSTRTDSGTTTVQTSKPTRRALLIGIENYEHDPQFQPGRCEEATRKPAPKQIARRRGSAEGFASLFGTMNDVCAIRELLIGRFNFEAANVHVLADKDATHDGILTAFKRYIIDEAQPGDICLFFYSGHGSQIRNTRGGEADQLDETLVPIDWKRPIAKREDVKEIRDKEIFKLFREASKKVTLTALFDSCHSGGISRGGVTTGGRAKTGPPELKFDLAEPPPDQDQKGESDQQYLERTGALVITAARDDQEARENDYGELAIPRGNFTYSLVEVLQSPNAGNLSAARIFDRLVVQMKSHNVSHEPVVVGSAARRGLSLFGESVDPLKRPEVNVVSVDYSKGIVALQGGLAMGLNEGCEFIKRSDEGKITTLRIRISQKPDYVKSIAEVVAEGTTAKMRIAKTIKVNDVFVLDKWAAPDEPNLVVWIPPAKLSTAQLLAAVQEIERLSQSDRVQIVADPTTELVTHFLFHDGANWLLKLPDNQIVTIGAVLTARAVLDKLPDSGAKAKLFYSLPPSGELAGQIKLGDGTNNSVIALAKSPGEAHYWLVGRALSDSTLEYCWLLPDATVGVAKAGETNATNIKAANTGVSPLPPITDWKTKSIDLEDLALRLGRIRGWIKLQSPQGDSGGFAYHLVLKNGKGEVLSPANATLEDGEILTMALVADESRLQASPQQRHVYVFDIDGSGTATLLYPDIANNGDTPFPYISSSNDQRPTHVVEVTKIKICGPDLTTSCAGDSRCPCQSPSPLGPETYVMLTTPKDEPLPDPTVLQSTGVRTTSEAGARGARASSPLQDLLTSIGSTSRGNRPVAPVNWSVEQVFFQSVPKKP
ncbi:MAG: putative Peptidase caspase catalytic subunit p20 [Acidobacteria bacterium]|nr:putative Peptidase caspase catalytic subunit p20 [Acidobacteriota bacterium]